MSLLVGGALVAAGALVGRVARLRRNPKPTPVCGCGHHYAMHDPITGICHAQRKRGTYDEDGLYRENTYIDCGCRVYTGPQPTQVHWHDGVAILPPAPAPAPADPVPDRSLDPDLRRDT